MAAIAKPVTAASASAAGPGVGGGCPGSVPQPLAQRAGRATAAPRGPALAPKAIFIRRRCCNLIGDWGKGQKMEGKKKKKAIYLYKYI